jgi:hypothetical protein
MTVCLGEIVDKQSGKMEKRILLNGKVLLTKREAGQIVRKGYSEAKGGGHRRIYRRIKEKYYGISQRRTNAKLKSLPAKQRDRPIFDNKAPLKPIESPDIQHWHQIDLVDFTHMPDRSFKYVLCVLDVFSRYLWLRPLETKSSKEISALLKEIYMTTGPPKVLQSDQGGEFKKHVLEL